MQIFKKFTEFLKKMLTYISAQPFSYINKNKAVFTLDFYYQLISSNNNPKIFEYLLYISPFFFL